MNAIYAIEITSRCNLSCDYCVHSKMHRQKRDISTADFLRSIELCLNLGQKSIILNNIGEPLLHSQISKYIEIASTNGLETMFHTNCLLIDSDMALLLKKSGLTKIVLSNQIETITQRAVEYCKIAGLNFEVNDAKNLSWGGQHHHGREEQQNSNTDGCSLFIKLKQVVIFSDGSIGNCCIDYENSGKLGTIWDENVLEYEPKPLSICKECHNV